MQPCTPARQRARQSRNDDVPDASSMRDWLSRIREAAVRNHQRVSRLSFHELQTRFGSQQVFPPPNEQSPLQSVAEMA